MQDHSIFILWLLTGGLFVVLVGLGVVGLLLMKLRRDPMRNAKTAVQGLATAPAQGMRGAISGDDIATVLCEEWAAFQVVYRADLAQILAEIRSTDVARAAPAPQDGHNRLDDAIALARAGHDADTLMRLCDLTQADAQALVRFHGPERIT